MFRQKLMANISAESEDSANITTKSDAGCERLHDNIPQTSKVKNYLTPTRAATPNAGLGLIRITFFEKNTKPEGKIATFLRTWLRV